MSLATLLPAAMLFRNQVQNILQYDNLLDMFRQRIRRSHPVRRHLGPIERPLLVLR